MTNNIYVHVFVGSGCFNYKCNKSILGKALKIHIVLEIESICHFYSFVTAFDKCQSIKADVAYHNLISEDHIGHMISDVLMTGQMTNCFRLTNVIY